MHVLAVVLVYRDDYGFGEGAAVCRRSERMSAGMPVGSRAATKRVGNGASDAGWVESAGMYTACSEVTDRPLVEMIRSCVGDPSGRFVG